MSMSTRIEDLPGPIPEDIIDNIHDIQNNFRQQQIDEDDIVRQNTLMNKNMYQTQEDIYTAVPPESNVTMNIRKRVKFKDENKDENDKAMEDTDMLSIIKDEINEENLILLALLILASRNELDKYIMYIPVIGSYMGNSSILITVTRCFILLLIYITTKHFLLPKIRI